MNKRVVIAFSLFGLAVMVLSMQIMLLGSGYVRPASSVQNSTSVLMCSTRGCIYDRNFRPLVNEERELIAAVHPDVSALQAVSAVLSSEDKDYVYQNFKKGRVTAVPVSAAVQTRGVQTLSVVKRYSDREPIAPQLIGYLNGDGEGVCGLEKCYDKLLRKAGGTLRAKCGVDAQGRLLEGDSLHIVQSNYNSAAGIALTLDKDIQKITQKSLSVFGIDCGAAVVLDAATAEIRAMASVPLFNPNAPAESQDTRAPFINRAIAPYAVGSVFKPIVSAAALEKGIKPSFSHACTGSLTVNGNVFNCHKRSGHGILDMAGATAASCNTYFISLALQTGAEPILTLAGNMGLGQKIELADDFYTESGVLQNASEIRSDADLANLSFGQGRLLASPLQMAAVYACIANNGVYRAPSLMQSVLNAERKEVQRAYLPSARRVLSEETVKKIQSMLRQTVTDGSGRYAEPTGSAAAGKTATAQSGWRKADGSEVTHSWFCGYFPYEKPKYVIVVFKENGDGGSADCGPVFRYIAEEILKLGTADA